ncbi:hypothetical protein AAFC00_001796 [Neodothiora populina]|uniref:HCP-like protein n=1 Tax=Neodothiora populina TaxID=2781224 RepID=A0ABR3PR87_9PEZI
MANHLHTPTASPKRSPHPHPLDEYNDYSTEHMFTPRGSSLQMHMQMQMHNKPSIRMQEAPSSPVSISPPRQNICEPSTAQLSTHSPPRLRALSRASQASSASRASQGSRATHNSIRPVYTPDSTTQLDKSVRTLSLHDSGAMTSEAPDAQAESPVQLHYHHNGPFDDSPQKKDHRASRMTAHSRGSSNSVGGEQPALLTLPPHALTRPSSQYTMSSEMRANAHSPLSADDRLSVNGSPRPYARTASASRRSPDYRPMSYIDLLNEVPYSQQIAPAPNMNNSSLQMAVGNNASLLDANKTLEMYRANVKKTNDPAIQYEFAIFMVNAAREAMAQEGYSAAHQNSKADPAAEMIKEARTILQRLADRAYPFAQYYLADGYFSGLFNKGKSDYGAAFPLFVAASKHGHAEAGYRAALCYEFGWGCSQSFPKAVQFFRNAASKGHPGAAVRLGKACLTGDMGLVNKQREGIKWLKRASESADTQYNSGPYELGILHITGFGDDIFKDEAYAAQLLTQAAELGHPEANFRMGEAYENGTLGCPRDAALSVHFYNGAATRGMPEAMMALCAWYMVGAEPVLEKDEVEAFEWAKKAAESGLPKAEYAVGYFTEMGIGCRRDPLEANMWYVRAADKGNVTARQRLDIIRNAASGNSGAAAAVPMAKGAAKAKELGGGKEKECVVM